MYVYIPYDTSVLEVQKKYEVYHILHFTEKVIAQTLFNGTRQWVRLFCYGQGRDILPAPLNP